MTRGKSRALRKRTNFSTPWRAKRDDIEINGMFRIYVPDVEKMKTWKTPQFEMLPPAK
jgi:hypothetical protein